MLAFIAMDQIWQIYPCGAARAGRGMSEYGSFNVDEHRLFFGLVQVQSISKNNPIKVKLIPMM